MKKGPLGGCLGYTGDDISYPAIFGIRKGTIIRTPIKQPVYMGL